MTITPFRSLMTLCALACVALASTPADASFDIDFGAAVRLGDDTNLYVSISSRYFDEDRDVVERYAVRYADPDDLAVAFYLSKRSRRSHDHILSLRQHGLSWWEISVRLGLPMDVWFVPVRQDPGPPYGKAYGHWKKHRRDRSRSVVLTDDDARNLVAVRVIHEYYDVPVEVAMEWRSTGRKLESIMADEYESRHGKAKGGAASHHHGKGKKKKKRHGKMR